MKKGWICPRCGKVNAPFIASCNCKLDMPVSNANSQCGCGGEHEWRISSRWNTTIGSGCIYICSKCGKMKQVYNSGCC